MESIKQLIEQIEESKNFIKKDTIYNYRIALILIDNCMELLFINISEKIMKKTSKTKKKKIRRDFREKINLLKDEKLINEDDANCIINLHRCRNGVFHSNKIQTETLYAYTLIYFNKLIDVFSIFEPNSLSVTYRKNERYFQRYGVKNYLDMESDGITKIAKSLRSDMIIESNQISEIFTNSIDQYIKKIEEAISFLTENIDGKDRDFFFKLVTINLKSGNKVPDNQDLGIDEDDIINWIEENKEKEKINLINRNNQDLKIDEDVIINWARESKKWGEINSINQILKKYLELEKKIMPIVDEFDDLAAGLSDFIQMQIDIVRGK